MPTIEVLVRRVSVVSSRPFDEIVRRLTATIGHPDMHAFHSALAAATTAADLEDVVQGAIGSSDLMEFVRFDAAKSCVRHEVDADFRSSDSSSVIRSS